LLLLAWADLGHVVVVGQASEMGIELFDTLLVCLEQLGAHFG